MAIVKSKLLKQLSNNYPNFLKKDLEKFRKIQDTIQQKGAGGSYKTYVNSLIRGGTYKPTYNGYMKHFENYWRDKVVGKVKTEKTKQIKREIFLI